MPLRPPSSFRNPLASLAILGGLALGTLAWAGPYEPGLLQANAQIFNTGSLTVGSLHWVDLDGDGRLELVSFAHSGMAIEPARADGALGPTESDSSGSLAAAFGDFDGDEVLDLVAVSYFSYELYPVYSVIIRLGNGDRTFQLGSVAPGPPAQITSRPLVGDFDEDGKLDVIITMSSNTDSTRGFRLYRGDGSGELEAHTFTVSSVNPSRTGSAVGDLDGDGHLDVLLSGTNLGWHRGHGDGTFAPAVPLFAGTVADVEVADLDGDAQADVAFTGFSAPAAVHVLRGTGQGAFEEAFVSPPPSVTYRGLASADVDDDGVLDLVSVGPDIAVFRGLGGLSFAPAVHTPTLSAPGALAVGDSDGDGRVEVAVAHGVYSYLALHRLEASAAAALAPSFAAGGATDLALGDVNGDAHLDFLLTGGSGGAVTAHLGDGAGGGGAPIVSAGPTGARIAALHHDGDARLDVVIAEATPALRVYHGLGDGSFSALAATPAADLAASSALSLGDLDGDGDLDALLGGRTDDPSPQGRVLRFEGIPGLPFASPSSHDVMIEPNQIAIGELDGDLVLDAVVAGAPLAGESWPRWLHGLGGAGFDPASPLALISGGSDGGCAIADVTPGGLAEVVCTGSLGSGEGSRLHRFVVEGSLPLAPATSGTDDAAGLLDVVDLNGDGFPDVIESDATFGLLKVRLGDGVGGFGPTTQYLGDGSKGRFVVGDLNGDGRPDVAELSEPGDVVTVLLNTGGGTVSAPSPRSGLPRPMVSLGPISPNPSFESTRIAYSLAGAGRVRVTVHDVRGRRVATLVDGERAAGTHAIAFDGRDAAGRALASGIYLVVVEAGETRAVGRLARVR